MAQGAGESASSRMNSALQGSGFCTACLSLRSTEIKRLYGPSWQTLAKLSRSSTSCLECFPYARSLTTTVFLMGTFISDASYMCDGRCDSCAPCAFGTESQLLSHFIAAKDKPPSSYLLPAIQESDFRHLLRGLCVRKGDLFKLLKETVACISCRAYVEGILTKPETTSLGFLEVTDDGDIRLSTTLLEADGVRTDGRSSPPCGDSSSLPDSTTRTTTATTTTATETPSTSDSCGSDSFSPLMTLSHTLLSVSESVLWEEIENVTACRKPRNSRTTRRCAHHTIDSQRNIKCQGWQTIWDMLHDHERNQICMIDSDDLKETIQAYVLKHKFCNDCKSKVLKAYRILTGELDSTSEKGYMSPLYHGLVAKPERNCVELIPTLDFISQLVARAMPEAMAVGAPNEVHAKTFDTAQEQVLLCVGLQLLKDLHSYATKCHLDYRCERLLILTSLMATIRQYQAALVSRGCRTELDNYEAEQQQNQQKKKLKRQRQKKKKQEQQDAMAAGDVTMRSSSSKPGTAGVNPADDDITDPKEESDTDCRCASTSSQPACGGCGDVLQKSHSPRSGSSSQASPLSSPPPSACSGGSGRLISLTTPSACSGGSGRLISLTTDTLLQHSSTRQVTVHEARSDSDSGCQADELESHVADDDRTLLNKMGWEQHDEDMEYVISQKVIDDYMANKAQHDARRRALRERLRLRFENFNCNSLSRR